jgi:hypothetical protein
MSRFQRELLLSGEIMKITQSDRKPTVAKGLMEANPLRRIPGGCDYFISEVAKKQEPQDQGTHQKASEGKAEQVGTAKTTRER